jgi:tetratricopeptide (TPR) repeat protein
MPLPDPRLRFASGTAWYARGVALAAKGRFDEARAAADSVRHAMKGVTVPDLKQTLAVGHQALQGEIALRKGQLDKAVTLFRRAVELEDAITYMEPPWWYYPMRHSLGKALLAAGRPAEAEREYRADLVRFPENGWALFGLAQSLRDQGKRAEADSMTTRFRAAWAKADITLTASRF